MRLRTLRLCLPSPLCFTLVLSFSVPLTSPGQAERWWLWTTDGLYYSRYIKHFLGGRGEWVDEIYERDDVAHGGIASVLFLRSKKERKKGGEALDIGVTLWYNRSITTSGSGSLQRTTWDFDLDECARSNFWPQEWFSRENNLQLFYLKM